MRTMKQCINLFLTFITSLYCVGCTQNQPKKEERKFPITVTNVEKKNVPYMLEQIGNVESPLFVQIRPQVGGIVTEAFVAQGQHVKKGDPLYQIDPRPYEAALEKAKGTLEKDKAALEFAKIKQERYKELAKQDYLSKLNYEQYQTDVQAAQGLVMSDEGDVSLAEINLEWTTPVSPIDGKVSQYNIDPGNLVAANDPNALTDIRQITPIDIRFSVSQKEFVQVQEADRKRTLRFYAVLPEDSENPREGEIFFVDNHLDLSTGTIELKGRVVNEDEKFWPGEYVRVQLELFVEANALLVPDAAVQWGQEGPFIYIYHPETESVEYRRIVKGNKWKELTIVKEGINPGEQVVVKGQVNLRPNSKVFISDSKRP